MPVLPIHFSPGSHKWFVEAFFLLPTRWQNFYSQYQKSSRPPPKEKAWNLLVKTPSSIFIEGSFRLVYLWPALALLQDWKFSCFIWMVKIEKKWAGLAQKKFYFGYLWWWYDIFATKTRDNSMKVPNKEKCFCLRRWRVITKSSLSPRLTGKW